MTDACYYGAAFNLSALNQRTPLGTLTLRHSGESPIVITLGNLFANDYLSVPSQFFFHWFRNTTFLIQGNDPSASVRYQHYAVNSLGEALETAMNAAAGAWPTTDFQVQWLENNSGAPVPFYKFTYGDAFTYQFSTVAGARLFGHTNVAESASAATHFLGIPSFVVFPSVQFCSTPDEEMSGLDYEPRGIASLVHADDGRGYGNARLTAPLYRNWVQEYETKEKTFRANASSDPLCTFQALFEQCRSRYPFFVAHPKFADPKEYPVFVLRDDGNAFAPRVASAANHAQIHVPFRAVSVGWLEVPA